MKEYVPVEKECEHCSKKEGSLGCCSTVNNNWVYSCAEGQKEWLLDKIAKEIEVLPIAFTSSMEMRKDCLKIIEKYKKEAEKSALTIAIKTLEKEHAIEKIKAEIKHRSEHFINDDGEDCLALYEDDVIEILTEYIKREEKG